MLLYQPDSGYCYNSDSVFLSHFINSFSPRGDMLDVGAGCGVVGLLVAKQNKKVNLFGVEKQDAFAFYAQTNARVNKIDYTLFHQNFLELGEEKKFDYIVSNPPFYHDGVTKSEDEMIFQARYNVNLPLKDFFKKVSRVLKPRSHFIFCYDASQFGLICAELDRVKLRVVDVQFVHPKKDRVASLVMVHARNGSKSLMKTHPPLITFDGDDFSKEVLEIYKKASTQSIKCQI